MIVPRYCALRGAHFACRMPPVIGDWCHLHANPNRRLRKPIRCGVCGVLGHNAKGCDLARAVTP